MSWNKHYWAIHYRTGMEIDRNTLFFIEGSKELLPRYVKTSKGLILPREIGVVKARSRRLNVSWA